MNEKLVQQSQIKMMIWEDAATERRNSWLNIL
jgi:hypothetical protein